MKKKSPDSKTLSVRAALLWIWGSTIVISGGVILMLTLKHKWNQELKNNPKFKIQSLVQKCSTVESLSTDYLAECLGIGLDRSFTIFEHSSASLAASLEASPLIKQAKVSRLLPATLLVEYSLRQPVAILQDYHNTVIDDEGVLFPLQPFRTPKLLPEITLGKQSKTRMRLALALLHEVKGTEQLRGLKSIDVSRAFSDKLSRREIIMVFHADAGKITFLRLPTENWKVALAQFFLIPKEQLSQKIVDMRLSNTAYLSSVTGG